MNLVGSELIVFFLQRWKKKKEAEGEEEVEEGRRRRRRIIEESSISQSSGRGKIGDDRGLVPAFAVVDHQRIGGGWSVKEEPEEEEFSVEVGRKGSVCVYQRKGRGDRRRACRGGRNRKREERPGQARRGDKQ